MYRPEDSGYSDAIFGYISKWGSVVDAIPTVVVPFTFGVVPVFITQAINFVAAGGF